MSWLIEVFDQLNTGRTVESPTYEELQDTWQSLLFHGDNKDALATLLDFGFRNKIDLICKQKCSELWPLPKPLFFSYLFRETTLPILSSI